MNHTATHPHPAPLRGLLIAQFFGAFNDNAWKLMVALLAIRQLAAEMGAGPALEAASQARTTLIFVVFTLPLALVSIVAGGLSDRFSKRAVIVVMKAVEVALMALAALALYVTPAGGMLPLVALAGMAVQSALFSPAKYGIVPELLPHDRLAVGNGQLELWTFLAIIGGTGLGGALLQLAGTSPWLAPMALVVCALVGFAASFLIPSVPRARASGGAMSALRGAWTAVRADATLRAVIAVNVVYWTIASLVGQDMLVYAKSTLALSDAWSGVSLAAFGIGVGVGSIMAGKLSSSNVEVGMIPLGAVGLAAGLVCLGLARPGLAGTLCGMGWLGVASGFIVVPVNALLQWRAPDDRRGAVIAFGNIFVFGGVMAGSLSAWGLSSLGLDAGDVLVAAGVVTAVFTTWFLWMAPVARLRMALFLITRTLYRLHVAGRERVPEQGGALLLTNPVSFMDGLLLLAGVDRPIRFLIEQREDCHPILRRLASMTGAIVVPSNGSPDELRHALDAAGRRLDAGELVCVFPEGHSPCASVADTNAHATHTNTPTAHTNTSATHTNTSAALSFGQCVEHLRRGRTTPMIPVHLDRVWGSVFSYIGGVTRFKRPARMPIPVTVAYGTPMSATATVADARQRVRDLGEASLRHSRVGRQPLHHAFVREVRRHPFRVAYADATRPRVTCLQALVGAIALARALRPHWTTRRTVGIVLPPSVGGVLVNLAATLSGRTVVNLNYTMERVGMEAAVREAGLDTVVASRVFMEKANLDTPRGVTVIWIDDVRETIGTWRRLTAFALAVAAPVVALEWLTGARRRARMDDVAAIIFSSGSDGAPKGVMLSHANIDANLHALTQVFPLGPDDRVLGILPLFHSFGYMVTVWTTITNGVGVVYHPTPLDAEALGALMHRHRVTILVATPTFLQLYLRRCEPAHLRSLRVVLTGAEALPERLAEAFAQRFGLTPVEGYGVTECSPVIAVDCPDFRAAGWSRPVSRSGTVGRPLPGVTVRIVDPDTFTPLPVGASGMLLVKGPNLMRGYVNRPDLTAGVMRDGWYVTGDLAVLDEDGFLVITGRLSRFAKIGGEMVSHGAVEDALHHAAGADTRVFAVTSVPDDKKGERLAVLHTVDAAAIPALLTAVAAAGLPNFFTPKKDAFIKVDHIPILGTGKLDLHAVKHTALEAARHFRDSTPPPPAS